MNKLFISLTALTLLFGLFLIWPPKEGKADSRPYIVTTTAQVGDIVLNIAGDDARVESLMGSGVDPHLYRPTRSDVVRLKRADMVFYNGLHLEGQMIEMLGKLADKKPSVAIATGLPKDSLLDFAGPTQHDPHIWMDVGKWIHATDVVKNELIRMYPERKAQFSKRAAIYKTQLKELNTHVRSRVKTIPSQNRILLTAHDAFGYLGAAYSLEVIGIQGISTESEAGLKRMEELVDLLVDRQIPSVFIETSVSDRNIKALIEGAAARGHKVEIGGELYSDAMGTKGTYEGTYIGMMDHNINTIVSALGGQTHPLDDRIALNTK
ncbi:MAG: manganese transporter [Micavibrio sp.]|nr:MAG: manganese transporter [Micavibrio sp.]